MKTKILICLILTILSGGAFADKIISKNDQIILKEQKQEYGPIVEWIPSEPETSLAIESIYKFLKDETYSGPDNEQRKIILNQISDYKVQFVGIITNGRKIIHCNFFPKGEDFKYANKEYVFVFDGGTSFWRIDYDIENNACLNFEVNGKA